MDAYERLMAFSILGSVFEEISSVRVFEKREQLWDECIKANGGNGARITYVEFGVHEGYSIRYFAGKNLHKDSRFIGLDSFEGLPEDWGSHPKGTFDTKGIIPTTNDDRISFIKGWFQDTSSELCVRLSEAETLIVHYDADLYSSTLYALSLKRSYSAIFDEFTGHETRALYSYMKAYNASISFAGKTLAEDRYPAQVVCRVAPRVQEEPVSVGKHEELASRMQPIS